MNQYFLDPVSMFLVGLAFVLTAITTLIVYRINVKKNKRKQFDEISDKYLNEATYTYSDNVNNVQLIGSDSELMINWHAEEGAPINVASEEEIFEEVKVAPKKKSKHKTKIANSKTSKAGKKKRSTSTRKSPTANILDSYIKDYNAQ
jgi:hypothetical protein